MKKLITLCISWLLKIWSVLTSGFTNGQENPQGPFLQPLHGGNKPDPLPEPAEKLPYVYYDSPREQVAYTICFYSPYLGMEREIPFCPRKARGKPFDNVRGIKVTEDIVLLRSILFTSNFPGDIREMAKQYEGRFPNKVEIEQIYAKFNEINQNLYECGEPLLKRRKYLYTSGNEHDDKAMNYCLNFENGQKSYADCDSFVCAVLVENVSQDTQEPEADITKSELKDEFDILCLVDGQQKRVPFSQRTCGEPIGIFPFTTMSEYIELGEKENKKHTDKDVDESRLLDEKFCNDVYLIKDRLNVYLKALGKPILEGVYLADSSYMRGCGWLIGFDDNEFHTLSSDYYGGNHPAKLRYMGCFKGN